MSTLSDTQAILLSTAAQRDSGSILPLPTTIKAGGGTSKALAALLNHALAEERGTSDPAAVRRTDGDLRFGLFITPAGLAAIGIEPEGGDQKGDDAQAPSPAPPPAAAPRETKTSRVLALLSRTEGATLPELIEATGWLPHTTRAALTGLRKKGHTIERVKRDDVTCYRIVTADAA